MKEDNAIRDKSRQFAIRIVRLYQYLTKEKREFDMSRQLLRPGTSIGANVTEALFGQSRADFGMKLSIAMKEAGESAYWIDLLYNTNYLNDYQYESINRDCEEILRLLQTITKTIYKK